MPLCHFQCSFDVFGPLLPFPSIPLGFGFEPPAKTDNAAACASPYFLQCRIPDTSFRPTNQHRTIFAAPPPPPTTTFLTTLRCLSVQTRWTSFLAWHGLVPAELLLLYSSHSCGCPFLPMDDPTCFGTILHVLRADHTHVHCPSNSKGVPLNAQATSFTPDCSCKSSHLFPSLCLNILLLPTLSAAPFSICSSTFFLPKTSWPWWTTPPRPQKIFTTKKRDKAGAFLLPQFELFCKRSA